MVLSTFTFLCNFHCHPSPIFFAFLNWNSVPTKHLSSQPLPSPLASSRVLSDSMNLTILGTLYKWNQVVLVCTYSILECIFKASLIYVTLLLLLHFQQQWIRVLVDPFLPSVWFWIFAACFWICHKGNLSINCWIGVFVGEGFLFCHLADTAAIWCFYVKTLTKAITRQEKTFFLNVVKLFFLLVYLELWRVKLFSVRLTWNTTVTWD